MAGPSPSGPDETFMQPSDLRRGRIHNSVEVVVMTAYCVVRELEGAVLSGACLTRRLDLATCSRA